MVLINGRTPEEIKQGLIDAIEEASWVTEGGDAHDLIDAVEIAHEKMAHALAYIQRLEAQVPQWISVEERLPEDDVNVLVYAIGNNEESVVAMTSYTHRMYGYDIEGWRSPWQYFFYEYTITHWMPLSKAPKEE